MTRANTLACQDDSSLEEGYAAGTHGWRYMVLAGVPVPKGMYNGKPVTPEQVGCKFHPEGVPVTLSVRTNSSVETNIGWVLRNQLKNSSTDIARALAKKYSMVSNALIGNDPAKEQLCEARTDLPETIVPFVISPGVVDDYRSAHPDATFIAKGEQLVVCWLNSSSGKFSPAVYQPEKYGIWHTIKPAGYNMDRRINLAEAISLCQAAALASPKPGFDHIALDLPQEGRPGGSKLLVGQQIDRYDIVVDGILFYKPANPDLTAVRFSCLVSPPYQVVTTIKFSE